MRNPTKKAWFSLALLLSLAFIQCQPILASEPVPDPAVDTAAAESSDIPLDEDIVLTPLVPSDPGGSTSSPGSEQPLPEDDPPPSEEEQPPSEEEQPPLEEGIPPDSEPPPEDEESRPVDSGEPPAGDIIPSSFDYIQLLYVMICGIGITSGSILGSTFMKGMF